jgi:hypothetical protein
VNFGQELNLNRPISTQVSSLFIGSFQTATGMLGCQK